MRNLTTLMLCTLLLGLKSDQPSYPTDYFRSPLGIPLRLSSNFAEMRSNRFHSGLDIKTNGREGYRVYAAADGWISRIKVSSTGYGNALYVQHPSGYMSVYAHMQSFSAEVAELVRREQLRSRRFQLDKFFSRDDLPVSGGDILGLSGNSGFSSGPHLHFEIRDSKGEWPINPILFGFDVPDSRPPRIFRVKVYPLGDTSYVRIERPGSVSTISTEPVVLEVELVNGEHRLRGVNGLAGYGAVGFALQAHDYHDGSRSQLGTYRITVTVDGDRIFRSEMEKFSFGETRYINAHVDYGERQRSRRWFQRTFRLPGNKLSLYESQSDGVIRLGPGASRRIAFQVDDALENGASLTFAILGEESPSKRSRTDSARVGYVVHWDQPFKLARDGIRLQFPAEALYESEILTYEVAEGPPGSFSTLHRVHTPETPVHRRYSLSLSAPALPTRLRGKALIASIDDRGNVSSAGGQYKNGYVATRPSSFGQFFVTVDTTAPTIEPLQFKSGANLSARSRLSLRIKDDLSGIDTYNGYVNDEWVIFEYDAKRNLVRYAFDEYTRRGTNHLRFEASDSKGNEAVYEADFLR